MTTKKLFLILIIAIISLSNLSSVFAQGDTNTISAKQNAQQLLAKLSPEQRVGQLFLVTFQGREINTDSQIYDLIVNRHISGMVLKRDNDNFTGPENTIEETFNLITALQSAAAGELTSAVKSIPQPTKTEGFIQPDVTFVPLFVGISQEGDLAPFDQIINGLTPLPGQMAIGATWNPALAEKVGATMGTELHILGFNLFLGPSLDVLDINYTASGDDLGTRTFGGDPFWVSQMGRAYIRGLHTGSNNQMAVIAKHFPGRGGSDRLPEEEVATVRKSLEQLKLIELAPFFAVTGNAADSAETADGLYLSHIRYQGFQGNIRATTKPISLDPVALEVLMKLPELANWRENGGVIVSDDLGSQAIQRFFDPTGKSFDAKQVARSAFLAGNDLLYMDRIIATSDQDNYSTILGVLDFFTQKYKEDRAFADRVDGSVERVLTLKFKMYQSFELKNMLPKTYKLSGIGKADQVSFEVARQAVSLISPESKDLVNTIPRPPDLRSNIVFFTDVVNGAQCSACKKQPGLALNEFENAVVRLYGPDGGGQITRNRLFSFSFDDLNDYLISPFNNLALDSVINKADWLIFSLLTIDPNRPASGILQRLLAKRPDLTREKKVIVFAFNTPYRLDATDISNLTAYYGLFSKIPSFVEVAARVLFQEINPIGASPVSVPGVAYDLITVTSPDPRQIIPLVIDVEKISQNGPETVTGQPTSVPQFFIGDVIPLKSGVILDHNSHLVPDNTVVKFMFDLSGEKRISQQVETFTKDGVALTSFRIQDPGMLEIKVMSEPASNSDILLLDISLEKSVVVSAITPAVNPTIAAGLEENQAGMKTARTNNLSIIDPRLEWLIIIAGLWLTGALMVWVGNRYFTLRWGIRAGLLAVIFGLVPYLWISLGLPGSAFHKQAGEFSKTLFLVLLGAGLGVYINWGWNRRNPPK